MTSEDKAKFKEYQKKVVENAKILARELMARGFDVVSGGTDNHLVLLNVLNKNLTGKEAERLLDDANITTNKNTVPNDPNGPFVTSGVRLGTPAMTTRGFGEAEVIKTVEAMDLILSNPTSEEHHEMARKIVKELCDQYPLYK